MDNLVLRARSETDGSTSDILDQEYWSNGELEYWEKIKSLEGFHEPGWFIAAIRDHEVLPKLHHSITPLLHKSMNFQETKSPLGIPKAGSSGPGFCQGYPGTV